MKKGFIALLIVLALIVLISPGIVGRLAEQSMDQDLEWTTTANDEVVVSSQGFERGWFSSEGQHRIELTGTWPDTSPDASMADERRYAIALLVDTRIDHGLIPVTSMSREKGSLAPGLGSAISTLSLEISDGTTVPLPGTIYSTMGVTGELQSNLVVEAGTADFEGRLLQWSDADILVTTSPVSGATSVVGGVDALSMTAPQETIRIGRVTLNGNQRPGPFGFTVGNVNASVESASIRSAYNDFSLGPTTLASNLDVDGDRVDGSARLHLAGFRSPAGAADIALEMRIENADGDALGKLIRSFESIESQPDAFDTFRTGSGVPELLAAGMELHIDRLDLTLPQGTLTSTLNLNVAGSDADPFSWAAVLLALDGVMQLHMSPELVEFATAQAPQLGTVVGLGYLRRNGALYETFVEIQDGVLTINGAPMQIPLTAFQ